MDDNRYTTILGRKGNQASAALRCCEPHRRTGNKHQQWLLNALYREINISIIFKMQPKPKYLLDFNVVFTDYPEENELYNCWGDIKHVDISSRKQN